MYKTNTSRLTKVAAGILALSILSGLTGFTVNTKHVETQKSPQNQWLGQYTTSYPSGSTSNLGGAGLGTPDGTPTYWAIN